MLRGKLHRESMFCEIYADFLFEMVWVTLVS